MEIYQHYGPALLRKAERVLQNREDAADIVQELFMDLLEQGKSQMNTDLPYLYRAVTNRCLNHLRDRKNRDRLLEVHDVALRGPARTQLDNHVVDLRILAKLAQRLDKSDLEMLIYRYVDDMSQDEIAELLGTSRKTVGRRLERIQQQVSSYQDELWGGGQ